MTLFFVTGNENKFAEVAALVPGVRQLNVELDEIQDVDSKKIITHKLREARKHSKELIAVEDVSFSMEALGGLPGPLIKWFLQTMGANGLHDLAQRLGNDRVTISATVGLMTPTDEIHYFSGEVAGKIIVPRGKLFFGFDPIFLPDGQDKTYGELQMEAKNTFSHRALAWGQVREFLQSNNVSSNS